MLNAIRISAPIKNEQLMIVGKLEKKLSTMEEVISEKQSLIEDLEAYKKSLIYEVVTGKRKVVA
jgi:type I restriction enzyme S subunit